MQKGRQFLSELKLYTDYLKWRDDLGRYETWNEACEDVLSLHIKKYGKKVKPLIDEVLPSYQAKEFLASQRSLQWRANDIFKHNSKLYNCFDKNEQFITSEGVRRFSDFKQNDKIKVLTHTGNWKEAVVKSYGKQKLYNLTFRRGRNTTVIKATKDHRWLLKNGQETTNIKIGDNLLKAPGVFDKFDFENAEFFEKLYWCYGYVYGDGSYQNGYSKVRLCGKETQYEKRFLEMGFSSSSSLSLNGDILIYTGKYDKTAPDPKKDSAELIRAFVAGYLAADGGKNFNEKKPAEFKGKKYLSIQSSQEDHIKFIKECFPIAGAYIISEKDFTGQKTNFGIRPLTKWFGLCDNFGSKYNGGWKLVEIQEDKIDEVWCLEVEDDKSFVMPNGIVTGNCCYTYAYSPDVFAKGFYVLLAGAGLGVSLKNKFVKQLPEINARLKGAKNYVVEDSIEGWADAAKVLISSYCKHPSLLKEYFGYQIKFDFSKIRPKGAMISGGFKAPGPEGLKQSLERIEELLNSYLGSSESIIFKSIIAYDVFMHLSDAVLSGGVRRSSMIVLMDEDDEDMINAKVGNWRQTHPHRARSNNSVGLIRGKFSKELFEKLISINTGENDLGFIFMSNEDDGFNPCAEIGFNFYSKIKNKNFAVFAFCVAGDTKLITEEGLVKIEDAVDNNIKIWNGQEWSEVRPYKTGESDRLHRVFFSDGSYLDATDNHKFLVKNRFEKEFKEVETLELINLLKESKYVLQVPRANINEYSGGKSQPEAYNYGFILGDGNCSSENSKQVRASLYNEDKKIKFDNTRVIGSYFNSNGIEYDSIQFLNADLQFSKKLKYDEGLPTEVFSWNKESIINFISGWADADGSNASKGIRIYGEQQKIRDAQLLLTKIGICSSVNLAQKQGAKTNLGIRKKDLWYLQITKTSELKTKRLISNNTREAKFKGKNQIIKMIKTLPGKHASYCLTEEKLHQCVFNNVLTKQCNLTEISASACVDKNKKFSKEKFFQIARNASIVGTLQAGFTDFPYLGEETKEIVEGEALIGVSITGWFDRPELFDAEILRAAAQIVKDTNEEVAAIIGINTAARCTTTKPSGNSSVVLGTPSGAHGEHSRRHFRIMQINKQTDSAIYLKENNPELVEESVWSSTNSDYVIYAPIETESETAIFKEDLMGVKHLEYIKIIKEHWVDPGKRPERCYVETTSHNVSNTVLIDDMEAIKNYVFENQNTFAAVSFLEATGDKEYNQAPFTSVLNTEELVEKYGDGVMFMSGLVVDGLHYFNDNLWRAADHVLNPDANPITGSREQVLLKKDWIRRVHQFAKNYFKKDLKQTIYCMKDVHLWHKWKSVMRSFKPVDFTQILKKPEYVDVSNYASIACAGPNGACEIVSLGGK